MLGSQGGAGADREWGQWPDGRQQPAVSGPGHLRPGTGSQWQLETAGDSSWQLVTANPGLSLPGVLLGAGCAMSSPLSLSLWPAWPRLHTLILSIYNMTSLRLPQDQGWINSNLSGLTILYEYWSLNAGCVFYYLTACIPEFGFPSSLPARDFSYHHVLSLLILWLVPGSAIIAYRCNLPWHLKYWHRVGCLSLPARHIRLSIVQAVGLTGRDSGTMLNNFVLSKERGLCPELQSVRMHWPQSRPDWMFFLQCLNVFSI